MCATDRLRPYLREAEVLNLTLPNQVLHRPRHLFNRHVRVNTMLTEEIDGVNLESLERPIGSLLDALWSTIEASQPLPLRTKVEPELGGDHHAVAYRSERFADELFVRERAVNLGGIEESNAARIREIISCLSPAGP